MKLSLLPLVVMQASLLANQDTLLFDETESFVSSHTTYRSSAKVLALIEAGVTFEDPDNVYIHDAVTVGAGTWIGTGVKLTGSTAIGTNCTLYSGAIIDSSTIGNNCIVNYRAIVTENSNLGNACNVGPVCLIKNVTSLSGTTFWHRSSVFDSTLGTNCSINPFTLIKGCTISNSITVQPYCHLVACTIEASDIGPFAILKNQHIYADNSVGPL